ncbi:uncharacterized protein GLRG_06417 [Colletotrichum graminicola M1.001]|uniref:Uncharacterized protein n=1 Tax=Colletotrichum graminicola (strain M1.001 / M2 / FGSC 10212) TaxID=645133 RepID=E3QK85_COLGM|nr:uncharacterized protein GLRG_06417 [Colletotrichum graminicola M1.001]EFQ31273.1 hypothetical protein GLRG_06417 [Colletotrichum graminicola M1.001]
MTQARTAYEALCQPSERAKYDNEYANIRAAWFRYRKWTEWQRVEDTTVGRGDSMLRNKLTSYSQKFMDKMKERRTQQSTVFVGGTPRNEGHKEVSDAAEEYEKDRSRQAWSETSCATDMEAKSTDKTIRIHRSVSVPRPTITGKAGGQK